MGHGRTRHREVGSRDAIRLFESETGAVARQHIAADQSEEGWREGVDLFPRYEAH